MNRNVLIIVAIAAVLTASFSWWFFENYEQYEEEIDLGHRGEAARNRFYAAELFLEKYNMQVESLPSILQLKQLPDPGDVLFIPTQRFDIGPDRVKELMDWVSKGGHLIVLARYQRKGDVETRDELFHELGVTTDHTFDIMPFFGLLMGDQEEELLEEEEKKNQKQETAGESASENPDNKSEGEDGQDSMEENKKIDIKKLMRSVLDIHINEEVENKKVRFWPSKWMVNQGLYETSWEVNGKNGAHLLEFQIEKGWVTLLSEIRFMTNKSIGRYDHAAFLHTLVHIDNSKRKLWIIRNDDSPSLLSILFDRYSPAMMTFIAFILFWLWYASRRFGPVTSDEQIARRSMSEHIVSAGHFQWRNRNRSELLQSVQKALYEQIAQTRPLWVKLSDKELAAKLAKVSGLDEDRIYRSITAKSVSKELDFAATIEVFSIIRKKL